MKGRGRQHPRDVAEGSAKDEGGDTTWKIEVHEYSHPDSTPRHPLSGHDAFDTARRNPLVAHPRILVPVPSPCNPIPFPAASWNDVASAISMREREERRSIRVDVLLWPAYAESTDLQGRSYAAARAAAN